MRNHKLGRKVLDYVDGHPDEFDMGTWGRYTACGTTACLAGHAMLLSGYTLDTCGDFRRPQGGLPVFEPAEAAMLLGLSGVEDHFFYEDRDDTALERFRAMVESAEKRAAEAGELA